MKWILPLALCALCACDDGSAAQPNKPRRVANGIEQMGRITHPRITESSGLVGSRRDSEIFWTHNDGGGRRQVLYAITRNGRTMGEFRVVGTSLEDWEDISADHQGNLYLSDTGNNDYRRTQVAVHRVVEPDLKTNSIGVATINRTWLLRFPKEPLDCESLVVWQDYGYLISKVSNDAQAGLYRFSLTNETNPQTLEFVGQLKIDSPVAGAGLSVDGRLFGVVAKNGVYVYRVDGRPENILSVKPQHVKYRHDRAEACTFVPEGLLVTAETREILLFTHPSFHLPPAEQK